jgi:hypothetical protein
MACQAMSTRLPAMNDALLSGTLDLLETLVGFDTRSSLSNLELSSSLHLLDCWSLRVIRHG